MFITSISTTAVVIYKRSNVSGYVVLGFSWFATLSMFVLVYQCYRASARSRQIRATREAKQHKLEQPLM